MPEQVQKILNRIVEWWKKFNNKQRIILLSAIGVVVIALIILSVVIATPKLETLYICDDWTEAAEIKELLDSDESIDYSTNDEGLIFYVEAEDEAAACMLLGANEFPAQSYSIDNVINGGLTTTEADKTKAYEFYLEQKFADHISQLSNVESCVVDLTMPKNDGTILSREEKAKAAVILNLSGNMDTDQAYALAQYISTQIGNDNTEGVTIIDQDNYLLYSGADAETSMGVASTQLSFVQKWESTIETDVKNILTESKIFANVQVGMNVDVNFDNKESVSTEYSIPKGMTGGAITQQSLYDYESTTGQPEGVPGTDTNDDTTYVIEDGDGGYTEISESDTNYTYDSLVTTIQSQGGHIEYDNCSVSVIATRYIVYDEAELKATGALDDMTWEEFKAANKEENVVPVDDMYIEAVANTTGFPANNISFICYEVPQFVDEQDTGRSITDYAQIAIVVLIFALLGYVVFRSTRSQKVEELEPEISVESLLESTVEAQEQLEDIGYNDKSEVRLMIEKFVDENPEAVAQLLRNWLNEDWE